MKQVFRAAALAFLVVVAGATPAYAYLDAGTGSMLLQLLLGGVGGVLMVGKLYWQRIKSFFVRRKDEPEATVQTSAPHAPHARGE